MKLLIFRTLLIGQHSDWSITLPSNGIPVSHKIDTGAQYNAIPLTTLKKFDPEPDFCPVNAKLSIYNNYLTLKYNEYRSDVSFIVVDSKSEDYRPVNV